MDKIQIDLKKLEKKLGRICKRNTIVLGLDTASKTGYCIAKTDSKKVILSIGCLNVEVNQIKDKDERNATRYEIIYTMLKNLIKEDQIVVIENVYYAGNPETLIILARIGAIAYSVAKEKKVKTIIWKSAAQARSALNINQRCPKGKSKIYITKRLNTMLGTHIGNNDEIDAIVLALNGLII